MESKWITDVQKHATSVDERAVAGIVRYCGIALQRKDSSLVSFSHPPVKALSRSLFGRRQLRSSSRRGASSPEVMSLFAADSRL